MSDLINITIDGLLKNVYKKDYIKAKLSQLKEFGYSTLTIEEVSNQLNKVLEGKKNLTVIGMFIKEDNPTPNPTCKEG